MIAGKFNCQDMFFDLRGSESTAIDTARAEFDYHTRFPNQTKYIPIMRNRWWLLRISLVRDDSMEQILAKYV